MRIALLQLAFALAAIAPSAHAQAPTNGTVIGWVTDNRNMPLAGAHIDVTDRETGQVIEAGVRANGTYTVGGLTVGRHYDLLARCIGYTPKRMVNIEAAPPRQGDASRLVLFELPPIEVRLSSRAR